MRSVFCSVVLLVAAAALGKEVAFTFVSSYDQSAQQAVAYVPETLGKAPVPLLVVAHYWGGDRFSAKGLQYYEEGERRGWIVVCPELHGDRTDGKTSLAAVPAQHDVMDAIAWARANHRIDETRIYIAGRSMGGMLAALMAAKYPDVFAAAVAGQPITDLARWVETRPDFRAGVVAEVGEPAADGPGRFAWERRSVLNYARNLQYLPLILWHGTNDPLVPPEHSARLDAAVREHCPYQVPVHWLVGANHVGPNYSAKWVCDQLEHHRNLGHSDSGLKTRYYDALDLVTDEAKAFFWLHITPRAPDRFARVHAAFVDGELRIRAENVAAVAIDRRRVGRKTAFTAWRVAADGELELTVHDGAAPVWRTTVAGTGAGTL